MSSFTIARFKSWSVMRDLLESALKATSMERSTKSSAAPEGMPMARASSRSSRRSLGWSKSCMGYTILKHIINIAMVRKLKLMVRR